jgi:hypothetical protein
MVVRSVNNAVVFEMNMDYGFDYELRADPFRVPNDINFKLNAKMTTVVLNTCHEGFQVAHDTLRFPALSYTKGWNDASSIYYYNELTIEHTNCWVSTPIICTVGAIQGHHWASCGAAHLVYLARATLHTKAVVFENTDYSSRTSGRTFEWSMDPPPASNPTATSSCLHLFRNARI